MFRRRKKDKVASQTKRSSFSKKRGKRGLDSQNLSKTYFEEQGYAVEDLSKSKTAQADLRITKKGKSQKVEVKEVHEKIRGEKGRIQVEQDHIKDNKKYVFVVHRKTGETEIHERSGRTVKRLVKGERNPSKIELSQLETRKPKKVIKR